MLRSGRSLKRSLVTERKPIVGGCATVLEHACRHLGAHPRQSGSGDHGALGILDRLGQEADRDRPAQVHCPGDDPEEGHAADPGEQPAPGARSFLAPLIMGNPS